MGRWNPPPDPSPIASSVRRISRWCASSSVASRRRAFAVVARCTGGHPLVIRNAPLDANGDPFPTTYWLTCPDAVKAVARVESEGWIARLNDRVQDDEAFDDALEIAHRAYAEERGADLPEARGWGGVAGTRTGVKCLHAHYAYHLAGGDDPVGAWIAERVEPVHAGQRAGTRGRDRPGHELDPAARGRAGRGRWAPDRARA